MRLDLHQQALPQGPRSHADGIQVLHQLHCFGKKIGGAGGGGARSRLILPLEACQQFLIPSQEIAVFVQVAHHILGGGPQVPANVQGTQLPGEVIGQGAGLGKEIFKRGLVALFKAVGGAKTGIEIILEIGAEVNLVERITLVALCLGCGLFDASLALRFFLCQVVDEGNALFQLLQHRILNDFGVDQLFQLQLVERQHADHLHQARRQNLPLRNLQTELWL